MNFSCLKKAVFAGVLLLAGAPALAQETSVGPTAKEQAMPTAWDGGFPDLGEASTRQECGVEPTLRALDPRLVECHARFDPLPPPTPEGAEQLIVMLREAADGADVSYSEPIALIITVLDREWWYLPLPKTRYLPVYRVKGSGSAETTVIGIVSHNGSTTAYNGGKIRELLLPRVTLQACEVRRSGIAKTESDPCTDLPDGVIYRPKLLLAKKDAELLFKKKAIPNHLYLEPHVVQDVQAVMEEMARLAIYN